MHQQMSDANQLELSHQIPNKSEWTDVILGRSYTIVVNSLMKQSFIDTLQTLPLKSQSL